MFYDNFEAFRRLLAPAAAGAHAWSNALSGSGSPWSMLPGAAPLAASYEMFYRLAKDYEKPSFDIPDFVKDGQDIAVMEKEVLRTPFCRLLHFKRMASDAKLLARLAASPAVLVVAPLSGHHATLLRDTVKTLLLDHDVYITEWVDARLVPASEGRFGLDDYVKTLEQFMAHLGADRLHVMAVCQPVVPVLAAIARMSARSEPVPASMILIGGPVDARQSPTAVNGLASKHDLSWFENNVIHTVPHVYPGAGRRVYPGFLQHMGFVAMNPERHAKAHWDFFQDLLAGDKSDADDHRRFYDEYNAVLDMPSEYYLETIRIVFQEFLLPKGQWLIDGEAVAPSKIKKTALLTIEGARDDISGQGQTQAAHALCSGLPNKAKRHLLADAGHYGLFSGTRWREEIYPRVRDFIVSYQPKR